MAEIPNPGVLTYQSKGDAVRDRRAASMMRALKLFMWGCIGVGLLMAGLSFSPVGDSSELPVSAVAVPLAAGALYLIIAIRRGRKRPLYIGSVMFLLCWLAFTALIIAALASIRREDFGPGFYFALGLFAVIFLPIDLGLLGISWGLFRLARAL